MAIVELERSYLSVANILLATDPKEELIKELVACLEAHLKPLKIRWNPRAFRAGLNNPELPAALLRKLEDFLGVAESLNWSVPKTVAEELDRVLEDIESFNPAFISSLRASRVSGRVPASEVKKRLEA
jgi:hypothetical protein